MTRVHLFPVLPLIADGYNEVEKCYHQTQGKIQKICEKRIFGLTTEKAKQRLKSGHLCL